MDKTVGVLGGGQLGRMMVEAANRLNIKVNILDADNAPAKQISAHDSHVTGSFKDPDSIRKLATTSDVLTVEIEHVDTDVLEKIAKETSVVIEPHFSTIRTIKDKYRQKQFLSSYGVATAESIEVHSTPEALQQAGDKLGFPYMLKSKTEAYDGRGNFPVKTADDIPTALKALGDRPLYAEKWADFKMELAVMVINTKDGALAYPTVETEHENSICKLVYAPARGVSSEIAKKAQELAKKAVSSFEGKGIFGVEMFLLKDDTTLLVNEIAPRPHNSGHYTIEACPTSQFDAHLRAILDLPIPESSLQLREPAVMLNILGGEAKDSHITIVKQALSAPRVQPHLYGKAEARPGRKMGHLTVTAPTMAEAETLIQPLIDAVDIQSGKKASSTTPAPSKPKPLVAVIMGSDSDMPKLEAGFEILKKFDIPFQARITSAHRTPDWMREFAKSAEYNGFKVIIAAAGGAAHLPGMVASWTALPVIGCPIKASVLDGVDSLYSMTQMPRGEPVATVGINNSTNAALLAARILGVSDERIRAAVAGKLETSAKEVLEKDQRLLEIGPAAYLKEMGN